MMTGRRGRAEHPDLQCRARPRWAARDCAGDHFRILSCQLSNDHPCISALYGPAGSVIFDDPYNGGGGRPPPPPPLWSRGKKKALITRSPPSPRLAPSTFTPPL